MVRVSSGLTGIAAVIGLLIPTGGFAQVQESLFRAGDGTAYQVLVATNLGGGAERIRVTTLAGSIGGSGSCSATAAMSGQPASAIGGIIQPQMSLHPYGQISRTFRLTPTDISEINFTPGFGGRVTLGTGAGAFNICHSASDCTGQVNVQQLVGLDSTMGGVPSACIADRLAAECDNFTSRAAFAFGVAACGYPPICSDPASVTVNTTVCAPEPTDGFMLGEGQAIVFVYDGSLMSEGFAPAVGGFGITTDLVSNANCPNPNSVVSATGDNDSSHTGPPPTSTPTITPGGPATPTFTRTATVGPRPDITPCNTSAVSGKITYADTSFPVSSATVYATGASSGNAASDTTGNYSLSGLMPTTWTIAPRKTGGVGAAVSALDAAYILQALAEIRDSGVEERLACDVTGNGTLSTLDATRILQLKVGLISRLPLAGACDTDWLFLPDAVPAPNQTVHNPLTETLACPTGSLVYSPLDTAISDQNFRGLVIGDCTGNWSPAGAALRRVQADQNARIGLGRARSVADGRLRVPIAVRAQSMTSLEIALTVADSLKLHGVRAYGLPAGAIVQAAQQGDRVRIAAASALPAEANATLVVTLEGYPSDAAVRIRGASVNEQQARVLRDDARQ